MQEISRRRFVQGSAAAAVLARETGPAVAQGVAKDAARGSAKGEFLLVGTGTPGTSKGIYAYTFDPGTGELTEKGLAAPAQSPTFLAFSPDKKLLFAVEEVNRLSGTHSGGLMSFTFDRSTGALEKVSEVSSAGTGPCHVAVDRTGRCVFVANYSGGSAASYTVNASGQLSDPVSRLQFEGHGPNAARQEAPHAHRATVSPGNGFVMINDLGLDMIHVYRLNAGTAELTPNDPPAWMATPGSGPRALRFHPTGKWAYCLCELSSTIVLLRWDEAKGTLETVQEIPMLPTEKVTGAAEIVIDRKGEFAYASNRHNDFLSTFSLAAKDGKLTFVAKSPVGGKTPRHIALDPSERWLLAADQDSDNIAVFARDLKTGRLAETGKSFPISSPQCALFD
jgi:6-phosphogluconolactonase